MKPLLRLLLGCLVLAAGPALAIDPGVAQGSLQVDATRAYKLTQAYAYRDKDELRIVISDREAPKSILPDLLFLGVAQAAREDKLHGLIVQADPISLKAGRVSVLHPSVFSRKTGVIQTLTIAGNRVSGEIESAASEPGGVAYRVKFSAPVFTMGARR